jgi:hypothetical protein
MIANFMILIDCKLISCKFIIKKQDNKIFINNIDNYDIKSNIMRIPIFNDINGITYEPIIFPIEFTIIDDMLFSPYIIFSSYNFKMDNDIDFFYNLESKLYEKYNMKFMNIDYLLNENNKNKCIELLNSYYNIILSTDINQYIKDIWQIINIVKLYVIYILLLFPQLTKKKLHGKYNIPKKIITFSNNIRNYQYNIVDENKFTFEQYIDNNMYNPIDLNSILPNTSYYIVTKDNVTKDNVTKDNVTNNDIVNLSNNKFIKIDVINKTNNMIELFNKNIFYENYYWYYFPPNIKINKTYLLFQTFRNITDIVIKNVFDIELLHVNKIMDYYYKDNKYSNLLFFSNINEEHFNDFSILKSKSYTNEFFYYIVKKYSDDSSIYNILEILFNQYNYPLKTNRIELDTIFDYILYISIYNYKLVFINNKQNYNDMLHSNINSNIPMKVKNLYTNIIKVISQVINNEFDSIKYNQKFYTDYLHKTILKIFLSDSNNISVNLFKSLVSSNVYEKFRSLVMINFSLLDVSNKLNWSNVAKKINYLNIYYKNHELVYYQDRLNKNIFPDNFDSRLKKIIENPFDMFKYLRKEKDFIRWSKFIYIKLINLYIVPISLSSDDFSLLGTMIYLLYNIKEQNIKDSTYMEFLKFCNNHNRLIIDNNRINLKIKENLLNLRCPLNLGFLAKHLTWNIDEITFDKTTSSNTIVIDELKQKIKDITKKYYKYKTKYLKVKQPNMEISMFSETSLKTPKNDFI